MLRDRGAKAVSPLSVPLMMANAARRRGRDAPRPARPRRTASCSACAAGAHAIGAATRMIQSGDADAVVAGGAEAALDAAGTRGVRGDGRALAEPASRARSTRAATAS